MSKAEHYHWHEHATGCTLTICWHDGGAQREKYLSGTNARSVHQRLLHAPDDERRVFILQTIIEGRLA